MLRESVGGGIEVLAFEHPQAGRQLVKGAIEGGELPGRAALRELAEESGIAGARVTQSLGVFEVGPPRQIWHAFVCEAPDLADHWTFFTQDGGGQAFRFFWHSMDEPADEQWHVIFRQALDEIRRRLFLRDWKRQHP